MNYKIPLALMMCSTFTASAAEPEHVWKAIAFGQSTDMNFSSNVLPDKRCHPRREKTHATGCR